MFCLKSLISFIACIGLVAAQSISSQPLLDHDHAGSAQGEVGPFAHQVESSSAAYIEGEPPLWGNLGTRSYKVSTTSDLAQRYFDQGLRLTYAFNYTEARRAFHKAQQLDPAYALCYWGEALVLGPNINASIERSAVAPALVALAKAKKAASQASEKERALIEALTARYSDDPKAERRALDIAYAEAMGRVAARFPDDQEIAILYAEALMDISPWDYWEAGGSRPKGRTAEIIEVLEEVLAKDPDHPGAIHYYIHMVEASANPKRAEPYADRLGTLMPGAGHLAHMPSHIYYRVGRYLDSLAVNKAAIAADEAYLAQTQAQGIYPQGYYPHAVHMLLVSAQMAGNGKTTIEAAQKLARVVSRDAAHSIPFVQPIKAAPYFAHVQFSSPETVLALDDPGENSPMSRRCGTMHAAWSMQHGVESRWRRLRAERLPR